MGQMGQSVGRYQLMVGADCFRYGLCLFDFLEGKIWP